MGCGPKIDDPKYKATNWNPAMFLSTVAYDANGHSLPSSSQSADALENVPNSSIKQLLAHVTYDENKVYQNSAPVSESDEIDYQTRTRAHHSMAMHEEGDGNVDDNNEADLLELAEDNKVSPEDLADRLISKYGFAGAHQSINQSINQSS
jgi:hypothetical protein